MMKQKRICRSLFSLLAMVLVMTVLLAVGDLRAATKATIENTSMYIGINCSETIRINNRVSKAKYTFKSNKTSVAKVSGKGKVTGVAAGTAKVTVTQTLNKKSKKIGTVTVQVCKASLCFYPDYVFTSQPGYYEQNPSNEIKEYMSSPYVIEHRNPKATYTVYSSDPNTLTITKDGVVTYVKPGASDVVGLTFKETYKKKTVRLGTLYVSVRMPEYEGNKEIALPTGRTFRPTDNFAWLGKYFVIVSEDKDAAFTQKDIDEAKSDYREGDILRFVKDGDEWHGQFQTVNEGTVYLNYFLYNFQTNQYDMSPVTQLKVVVKNCPTATDIKFSKDTIEWNEYWDDVYVDVNPWQYSGEVTITSANPDVATATLERTEYPSENEDEPGLGYGRLGYLKMEAKSFGKTEITVELNGVKKTIPVIVHDLSDWYDDDDLLDGNELDA